MASQDLVRGIAAAQRARERIRREGRTPKGHFLWTAHEDEVVRRLYPNYRAINRRLRRRTFDAIKARAWALGITTKCHVWLTSEVALLRRLYPRSSRAELQTAFPNIPLPKIISKIREMRLRKPPHKYKATGYPLIDAIRDRATQLNLSMSDLDEIASSRNYFRCAGWNCGNYNGKFLLKVVEGLGGRVNATWE